MLTSERASSERTSDVSSTLELQGQDLTIEQVHATSCCRQPVKLPEDEAVREQMQASVDMVRKRSIEGQRDLRSHDRIWQHGGRCGPQGVCRCISGQSCCRSWLLERDRRSTARHVRAAMLLRANMLLRGVSGVRFEIVERLDRFLGADAIPVVREFGSIGASGDLVPLASIARAITGHGSASRVVCGGQELDGQSVLADFGFEPLEFFPKRL